MLRRPSMESMLAWYVSFMGLGLDYLGFLARESVRFDTVMASVQPETQKVLQHFESAIAPGID